MATLVMKFGGSLTADPSHISRVAQVITAESQAWDRLVVVISAMSGATDRLSHSVDRAVAHDAAGYRRDVAALRSEHIATVQALFEDVSLRRDLIAHVDSLLFDVLAICDSVLTRREASPRDRDAAMAAGERMMVHIIAALVRLEGLNPAPVDATSFIVTDDRHQSAIPLIDIIDERVEKVILPLLNAGVIPLVTGFIGTTRTGAVTTLGRGGSDYTATILAASLHADEVWMWSHVDGVMSADPEIVPSARVIPTLSYSEVGELSYFGAQVIHPRAVEPLLTERIPLRVRNPFNLDHAGTLIQAEGDEIGTGLKAVTAVDGLALSATGHAVDLGEMLRQVYRLAGRTATGPVIVIQGNEQSLLVFVVPTSEGPSAAGVAAQRLTAGLSAEGWTVRVVKVIAAMGPITSIPLNYSSMGVHPIASVLGPNARRLIAVDPSQVQQIVRHLHKLTNQTPQNASEKWSVQ
ncbi:MAG: aspartate kinase [Chloroflexota bacterium]